VERAVSSHRAWNNHAPHGPQPDLYDRLRLRGSSAAGPCHHRADGLVSPDERVSGVLYDRTIAALRALGVDVAIERPEPFDLSDSTPFAEDTAHATYDPEWVTHYWRVLSQVALVLEEFAARFSGKTSPVHHFWHTFDIAVTRFSDRHVDHSPDTDPITREAYSREVISFGFWFGDEKFTEPAFYSYTAPEPEGSR
jgi:hypothetical protein